MTAKRFKHSEIIQDDGQTICYGIEDTQTKHIFNVIGDGIYDVSEKELIKLLNELHEENEQLKSDNKDYVKRYSELFDEYKKIKKLLKLQVETKLFSRRELEKENEQLKTTIQQLRTDNTKQKKKLNTTMKENEHTKQTIKDMINTERTEIGKMTLRHLWRQIQ